MFIVQLPRFTCHIRRPPQATESKNRMTCVLRIALWRLARLRCESNYSVSIIETRTIEDEYRKNCDGEVRLVWPNVKCANTPTWGGAQHLARYFFVVRLLLVLKVDHSDHLASV